MSEVTVEHLRERIEDAWLGWEAEGLTHCIATTKESELAAFDAMAEKAVNFDIFRAILNKTRSVHAEIDGDQFWFHMPNSISGTDFDFIDALNEACFQIFDSAEEIAEALKAVPE